MVSSPATYGTLPSRLPLTLENLQTLPKNARFVDAFVSEQRRNARFYAAEEVLFSVERPLVKTSKEVKKKQESNLLPPSPLLKSRLEMGHVTSVDADGPSSIPNPKELFKSFTHAREGEVLRKGSQKTSGRTKRARSPSDDEERSARLKARRDRKRARREIIKPTEIVAAERASDGDPKEEETPGDKPKKPSAENAEQQPETELTIRKPKGRKREVQAIGLMETFTANNVKKTRLTLQPRTSGGLFKQARSGEAAKLGEIKDRANGNHTSAPEYPKENVKPVVATKNKKSTPWVPKSNPNPLETYSKRILKSPEKEDSPHERTKKRPSSVQSVTGTSSVEFGSALEHDSESCKRSTHRHPKGPFPRAVCISTEKEIDNDGRAYSESWGIGSCLPPIASSVHSIPFSPCKHTCNAQADKKSPRASPAHSEPAIIAIDTPWNFGDPQSAFGRFETTNMDSPGIVQDTDEKEQSNVATAQDDTVPNRSHICFSPLIPIPEHVRKAVAFSGYVDCRTQNTDLRDTPTYPPVSECRDTLVEGPQAMPIREPSPANSLDRLLYEYDAEDKLHGHLFIKNENKLHKWESVPTRYNEGCAQECDMEQGAMGSEQLGYEQYQYENDTKLDIGRVGTEHGDFRAFEDVAQFSVIDHSRWEEDPQMCLYDGEIVNLESMACHWGNKEEDVHQLETHSDIDGGDSLVDDADGTANGESWQYEEEPEHLESLADARADMLPFAEGRLLLLGFSNDGRPTQSPIASAPRSSTYGQTVQEIEVMVATQLGHHW